MCTSDCGSGCFKNLVVHFIADFGCKLLKKMYGIKNNSSGVVDMYVMTSVTHKPEVRIDLLTFIQIVNNFALEPYSKLCSVHNLFMSIAMSAKFPCVSKRRIMPGIIDLPNSFNYEDLEEIFAGGQGSFAAVY